MRVPTLVIHPKDDLMVPFEWGRALAAQIPGARLKPTDSDCHWLLAHDSGTGAKEYFEAMEDFLQEPAARG